MIKYIYYEIYSLSGSEIVEPRVQNANILVNKPHTNSNGVWGFICRTKRLGFKEESYTHLHQNWIDLTKYKSGNRESDKTIYNVVKMLEETIDKNIIILNEICAETFEEKMNTYINSGYTLQSSSITETDYKAILKFEN